MADFAFTHGLKALFDGSVDFDNSGTGKLKVMLVTTATTADADSASGRDAPTIDDIGTLGEASGSGYERKTLSGNTVTADTANNRAVLDASSVTWTSLATQSPALQAAIVYWDPDNTDDDTTNIPIFYFDSGVSTTNSNGGDYTLQWNASGIARIA